MSEIAEVLERAAKRLSKPGAWAQGCYGFLNGGEKCCAIGAIGIEAGATKPSAAEKWVDENAAAFLGMDSIGLENWNDSPSRRKGQVVAKLREAAAKAREMAS